MPGIKDKETAIVKDSDALHKKTVTIPAPQQNIGIDLSKSILDNIIGQGTSGTGNLDLSTLNSFTGMASSREQVYQLLDTMSEDSIISAILETYAEDATEYNDEGQIIWVESSDAKVSQFVTYLLDTMQVDKNAYKWVYSLIKYGDLYLQLFKQSEYAAADLFFKKDEKETLNEAVRVNAYKDSDKFVHYVEAVKNPAEMFELTKFGKTIGYIKANVINSMDKRDNYVSPKLKYTFKKSDVDIYDATKFVHATLDDNSTRTSEEVTLFIPTTEEQLDPNSQNSMSYSVKRGQSLLYNSYKIWRELSLMENSLMLNRLTKSAITRLVNVEIGDMPKEMVGPHLQGIKQMIEQKASINAGNSMTEYTNPGPVENNIYIPTHDGVGAISANTIGGDVDVGQLYDIDYFQNKYFGSMRIPKQYFGLTDDGAGFNGGQSLAIISSRYAKAIKRIQNSLIQAITDAVNLMLIDKGLTSYLGQFTIKMLPPTTQEEIDRRDNKSQHVAIASDVMNLLSDIEDPVIKMKITKALISKIITDGEVIELINDQIDLLEDQAEEGSSNPDIDEDTLSDDFADSSLSSLSSSSSIDSDMPLDLDDELGIDEIEETENIDDEFIDDLDLPNPDDLGIDMTDNNNPELQ